MHERDDRRTTLRIIIPLLLVGALFVVCAHTSYAQLTDQPIAPTLSINIPTVNLSNAAKDSSGTYGIPWLGQYIAGVYKYGVSVAGLLAAVMFVVGGFTYMTAGGDAARVSAAKERITDAVVGFLLILGAYLLLNTINPDLVSFAPIPIKAVVSEKFMLDHPDQGGFAPPDAFTNPKVSDVSQQAANTGVPMDDSGDIQNSDVASADTSSATTPAVPAPPTNPVLFDGPVPDLYQSGNELGVTVSGSTPARRMNSVCVNNPAAKYPAASDMQSILKRAAAITRVWITEAVYKNGAIYDRGGSSSDFWFVQHAYAGNTCMQGAVPYSADMINSCNNQTTSCTVEGANYNDIWHSLQQSYQTCWTQGIAEAGFSIGQCSSWVLMLAKCALGNKVDSSLQKKTLTFPSGTNPNKPGISNPRIDPQPWKDAMSSVGGAKPFDVYHLGKSPYGLCHSVMYIGGMGLKTAAGQPIYWIEMGGGGAADLSGGGGAAGGGGMSGKPQYQGASHVGVSIHFNPFIDTFSRISSCYYKATDQIMVRLLDQVQ